jgi:hypothetical protein
MENERPHFNVLIATPGHSMLQAYVRSLAKTIYFFDANGISWNFLTEYSSLVADAREKTIGGLGYQDPSDSRPGHGLYTYDRILWIDSDIEWEPEDIQQLFSNDFDVVSGCYMLTNGEVTAYPKVLRGGMTKEQIMAKKKPFEVRGVGFGFLAVKQGVFEKIKRPWFSQIEVEVENEETGEIEYKFPLMGEDLSWCEKVHRMGIPIMVDPLVRVNHHKQIKIEWPK